MESLQRGRVLGERAVITDHLGQAAPAAGRYQWVRRQIHRIDLENPHRIMQLAQPAGGLRAAELPGRVHDRVAQISALLGRD